MIICTSEPNELRIWVELYWFFQQQKFAFLGLLAFDFPVAVDTADTAAKNSKPLLQSTAGLAWLVCLVGLMLANWTSSTGYQLLVEEAV